MKSVHKKAKRAFLHEAKAEPEGRSAGARSKSSPRIFQETFKRVLVRAEFQRVVRNGNLRRYIRFHDLRHTFASHWVMNEGDIFKLQKILGHSDSKMTDRYAHLAPHAFSADYGRMGDIPLRQDILRLVDL